MVWPFTGKIGSLTYTEVTSFLIDIGYQMKKKKSTAHEQWERRGDDGTLLNKVTVDKHQQPFSVSLIRLMASQAGYNAREFYALCSKKSTYPSYAQYISGTFEFKHYQWLRFQTEIRKRNKMCFYVVKANH